MKRKYSVVSKDGTYNVMVTNNDDSRKDICKAEFEAMQVISVRMIGGNSATKGFIVKATTDKENDGKFFALAKKNGKDLEVVFYTYAEWNNRNSSLPKYSTYVECEQHVEKLLSTSPWWSFVQHFRLLNEDFCIIAETDVANQAVYTRVVNPLEIDLRLMALPQIECTQNSINLSVYC